MRKKASQLLTCSVGIVSEQGLGCECATEGRSQQSSGSHLGQQNTLQSTGVVWTQVIMSYAVALTPCESMLSVLRHLLLYRVMILLLSFHLNSVCHKKELKLHW